MRKTTLPWALGLLLVLPATARADEDLGLMVGAKLGVGIGLGAFGSAFVPELEVGYDLWGDRLAVVLAMQYAAPKITGTLASDARLPGDGAVSYEIVEQQFMLALAGLYRFDIGSETFRPYAALGPRLYFVRGVVNGDAGRQGFGENVETATRVGLYLAAGTEVKLGPGNLVGELQFGYASLNGYVLRNASLSTLGVLVGYRVGF